MIERTKEFYSQSAEGVGQQRVTESIQDPWKHRSKGMHCDTCIWFVPKERIVSLGNSHVGRCRRHAPSMGGYPVVYMTDWCGDHRIDENKI